MENELSLERALRDQRVLVAGQDERVSPDLIDTSEFVTDDVIKLAPKGFRFPISFDRSVWPRPCDLDASAKPAASRLLELEPFHACGGLGGWRLGAALLTFSGPLASKLKEMKDYPASPPDSYRGWAMVGFDVMDHGLALSGLLNLGEVGHSVAAKTAESTSSGLNEFLLWRSSDSARRFADLMSTAVSAHAPFEVLALYLCAPNE